MGLISFFRKWCHLVVSEATTADPFRFGRLKKILFQTQMCLRLKKHPTYCIKQSFTVLIKYIKCILTIKKLRFFLFTLLLFSL